MNQEEAARAAYEGQEAYEREELNRRAGEAETVRRERAAMLAPAKNWQLDQQMAERFDLYAKFDKLGDKIFREVKDLLAERDELLAALKEMVEFIRVRNIAWRLTEKDGLLLCEKIGKATAAIARVEGKT